MLQQCWANVYCIVHAAEVIRCQMREHVSKSMLILMVSPVSTGMNKVRRQMMCAHISGEAMRDRVTCKATRNKGVLYCFSLGY